jgi:riboflavin biosynthesis pyrimidine reductase
LVSALFDAGLVDRFYWVQSPLWLGPKARPAFGQMSSPLLDEAERWTVVERRALGVDTLIVMDRQCSPVS